MGIPGEYDLGPKQKKLNPQRLRFVHEYLIDRNAKKAAIRAGYSIPTAKSAGYKLLQEREVKDAITEAQNHRAKRIGITQDRVLQELALLAFSNLKDYVSQDLDGNTTFNIDHISRDHAGALVELYSETNEGPRATNKKKKIKLADKRAALVDIGKHLGMFKDQVEVTGNVSLEQLVTASLKAASSEPLEIVVEDTINDNNEDEDIEDAPERTVGSSESDPEEAGSSD